ncbi:MAG: hypothetical protein EBU10_06615 [Alphaproteobacteria bacterium]|nr:hypothetical protein [Alphaproteobacteria bacterium]
MTPPLFSSIHGRKPKSFFNPCGGSMMTIFPSACITGLYPPNNGGGFGMKTMGYPEYFLTAMAARHLGRSVRWMSDRTEAMLADNAGRDF